MVFTRWNFRADVKMAAGSTPKTADPVDVDPTHWQYWISGN